MLKKVLSLTICVSLLAILPACFGDTKQNNCTSCNEHHDDHAEIKEAMPGLLVINVLDREHFENCRVPGSVSVPFELMGQFIDKLEKVYSDKNAVEIVVYCSNYMCSASGEAADLLVKRGFENVKAYEGGIAEWYQHGLPYEGPCALEDFAYLKKVMNKIDAAHAFKVISTKELAQKLGFEDQADSTENETAVASDAQGIK